MRIHWIAAIAALAVLGGCDSGKQEMDSKAQAELAIAPGTAITGAVTLREPIAIGAGAKLDLKLVDAGQPEPAIATKTIDVSGAPPYSFSIDFDRSRITAARTYVLNAMLTDGDRRFLPGLTSPVLTHGASANVQIVLTAEATPSEKLKEEYSKLQGRIGAIHLIDSDGTLHGDETSTHRPFGEGFIDFKALAPRLLAVPNIDWWCIDMCFWAGSWEMVAPSRAFVADLLGRKVPV